MPIITDLSTLNSNQQTEIGRKLLTQIRLKQWTFVVEKLGSIHSGPDSIAAIWCIIGTNQKGSDLIIFPGAKPIETYALQLTVKDHTLRSGFYPTNDAFAPILRYCQELITIQAQTMSSESIDDFKKRQETEWLESVKVYKHFISNL